MESTNHLTVHLALVHMEVLHRIVILVKLLSVNQRILNLGLPDIAAMVNMRREITINQYLIKPLFQDSVELINLHMVPTARHPMDSLVL